MNAEESFDTALCGLADFLSALERVHQPPKHTIQTAIIDVTDASYHLRHIVVHSGVSPDLLWSPEGLVLGFTNPIDCAVFELSFGGPA